MAIAHLLGYPRIGERRELKFALEAFWKGECSAQELRAVASELRTANWRKQHAAGLDFVAVGDFSLYDHVLDHAVLFGAVPSRFGLHGKEIDEHAYFALARGNESQPALEMTKWFDTNYHYLVPELDAKTAFKVNAHDYLAQVDEAQSSGVPVKPVLLGPVSFLHLSKAQGVDKLSLLDALCREYAYLLAELKHRNIEWVQIDEPVLALDLDETWLRAFERAYAWFRPSRPKILLATYFASVARYQPYITSLPVDGIHLDLVRAPQQLGPWVNAIPGHWVLSAGVIDGRNIWRTDLDQVLALLEPWASRLTDRLWLAPSCSLLHVPVTLAHEHALDGELRSWLAFADEKVAELGILRHALNDGAGWMDEALAAARTAIASRRKSSRVHDAAVKDRIASLSAVAEQRPAAFIERQRLQRERLQLPLLPTTTIGSFPQTGEIRGARAALRSGRIDEAEYEKEIARQIEYAIREQEALGLDMLVHGEAERNDMVEYFGEQLAGYAFTQNGWVQSYGSRCVKPPIIYGDVSRPQPMTVETARYAQSLTARPVKGMLTGPVTMLQWSFVRDDQPRQTTALQIALAIRDEVDDLQRVGIAAIQIDEPALREGLPLQQAQWQAYLAWAVRAFRVTAGVADSTTQIHTHMCYAEFGDILPSIAALDADVITIETSRSHMELLDAFGEFRYPNEIGPGVYDIHSPRIPSVGDIEVLLRRAAEVIPASRLWVNPDCGLKTRRWEETRLALRNMVDAAQGLRGSLQAAETQ